MNIGQNRFVPPSTDHYVTFSKPDQQQSRLSGRVSPSPPPTRLSGDIGRWAKGQLGPNGPYALAPRMTPPITPPSTPIGTSPGTPSTPRSLSASQSQDEFQMQGTPHHIRPESGDVRRSREIHHVALES